jgi:3-polyprenyl-4-hydroxybenzoate decarboxylase
MMKTDLRSWLNDVEAHGELKTVEGADWNKEIGTVVELNAKARGPALLFDKIRDYPAGFRLLAGAMSSAKRLSLTLGMPLGHEGLDLIRSMKDKMRGWSDELDEFPPMPVKDGAIFQNVDEGERVNLLKFPAPLWHHDDGGRYIGTGSVAIMRERNGDWVNLGTYRVMIHDEKSTGIFIAPGHHGRIIMESYWKAGEPCPIAISAGHHPVFLFAGSFSLPPRVPEYNYVGSVLHERIPVVAGRLTPRSAAAGVQRNRSGGFPLSQRAKERRQVRRMAGLPCQRCQAGTGHPSKGGLLSQRSDYLVYGRGGRRTTAPTGIRSSNRPIFGSCSSAPESAASPACTGRSRAPPIF